MYYSYQQKVTCPTCNEVRYITSSGKKDIIAKCRHCGKLKDTCRILMKSGYVRIRNNDKNMYEYEHRYIWEKYYSEIPKGFIIHHKDGNRQNNNIDNLELMLKKHHDSLTSRNYHEKVRNGFYAPRDFSNINYSMYKHANQRDFPKDEILNFIQSGISLRQIAKHYGTSHGVIRRNMRDYNITLPKKQKKDTSKKINRFVEVVNKIKKEDLIILLGKNISQRKISIMYGVSHTTIQRKLKEFGL